MPRRRAGTTSSGPAAVTTLRAPSRASISLITTKESGSRLFTTRPPTAKASPTRQWAVNAAGLKQTIYEGVMQGDKDFSALISKMKEANIDVIYYGGYHAEAGLMVRQAREQGLKATLISGDALVDNEFWKITGPAGEGTLMTFAPDPRKAPEAKDIVAKFKQQGY